MSDLRKQLEDSVALESAKAGSVVKLETLPPQNVVFASETSALISIIERAARDPSVDVEKFERLMLMKERVEKQIAERQFNAAIAAAKLDIGPIVKNKTVDFTSAKGRTNYRHEDLAEIARTIDPILARNGLSYRHKSEQIGQKLRVTCIVSHAGGYSENTTLEAAEDHSGNKNTIQAIGSAATYLQRYTLKLALGLSASVDDDGNGNGTPKKAKSSAAAKRDGDMTKFNEIKLDIQNAITIEHLKHVNQLHEDAISEMPHAWFDLLKQDYDAKLESLQAVQP